jgi:amyloid beta precursor protein binding protein 1
MFKSLIPSQVLEHISDAEVDSFVKNSHALKSLRGKKWGVLDANREALGGCYMSPLYVSL